MRTYGRFFAEFLSEVSLIHLRLLASPTCVGLSTVVLALALEVFLGTLFDQIESTLRLPLFPVPGNYGPDLPRPFLETKNAHTIARSDWGTASPRRKTTAVTEY